MKKQFTFCLNTAPEYTFKETYGRKWVNYGKNNSYPYFLQTLSTSSSLHGAILTAKLNDTLGDGITYTGDVDVNTDAFLAKIDRDGSSFEDFIYKVAYDYILSGGYSFLVTWSKDKKTILGLTHIEHSSVRVSVENDPKTDLPTYGVCEDWTRQNRFPVKEFAAFDWANPGGTQLYYYKNYRQGLRYYPVPSYVHGLTDIATDVEVTKFNFENIKNGLVPTFMVNICSDPENEEQRQTIAADYIDSFTGEGSSASKIIVSFAKDRQSRTEIVPIASSTRTTEFTTTQAQAEQSIITAHGITSPLLLGIKTEGQLGGNNEMYTAFKLYMYRVIYPIRKTLLAKINEIFAFNGLNSISFVNNMPFTYEWPAATLEKVLTTKEIREAGGFPEIIESDVEDQIVQDVITDTVEENKI